MDDPEFPLITYRRGSSGVPVPVLRGTGIRVQTIVIANQNWQMAPEEIAENYELSLRQIEEALAFFEEHRTEIEGHIAHEDRLTEELYG
jgi:uncharacterized protein (DUF433 family)